jgi:hypothetical protein
VKTTLCTRNHQQCPASKMGDSQRPRSFPQVSNPNLSFSPHHCQPISSHLSRALSIVSRRLSICGLRHHQPEEACIAGLPWATGKTCYHCWNLCATTDEHETWNSETCHENREKEEKHGGHESEASVDRSTRFAHFKVGPCKRSTRAEEADSRAGIAIRPICACYTYSGTRFQYWHCCLQECCNGFLGCSFRTAWLHKDLEQKFMGGKSLGGVSETCIHGIRRVERRIKYCAPGVLALRAFQSCEHTNNVSDWRQVSPNCSRWRARETTRSAVTVPLMPREARYDLLHLQTQCPKQWSSFVQSSS